MKPPPLPSRLELLGRGRELRKLLPRRELGAFQASDRDVVAMVRESNQGRLNKLIPLKMARMAMSPFAFFRGSARIMAWDLASQPVTGIRVQICGDAHLQNLGAFATQHGDLIFDLNDFDETTTGPWEWDLKRLAASVVLAGRVAGHDDARCLEAVWRMARRYRKTVRRISGLPVLRLADFTLVRTGGRGPLQRMMEKARRKTPAEEMLKSTQPDATGLPRFRDTPPLQYPVDEATASRVIGSLVRYRETLSINHQAIFDSYHASDVSFKVVGTGSVGSRDYIVLMFGTSLEDALFLQIKEAFPSCYAPYFPEGHEPAHHGQRVAQGQQRMQIVTDPFLGWTTIEHRHFLVRKLAEHKASIKPADLAGKALTEYALVCGESLAKAHARTGDGTALAGYLGSSNKFAEALAVFARRYADQVEKDYAVFMKAIAEGIFPMADDPLR